MANYSTFPLSARHESGNKQRSLTGQHLLERGDLDKAPCCRALSRSREDAEPGLLPR